MKFCSLTRELCGDCKLVRKLAACAVVERFIKDMTECPKEKQVEAEVKVQGKGGNQN